MRNKKLGTWCLGQNRSVMIRGTTPTNADIWTLDIVIGKWELWMGSGKHAYITLFKEHTQKFNWERSRKNCDCYFCEMNRPLPEGVLAAMLDAMNSPNRPTRKLPSRDLPVGCNPSDCCGDEEAHNEPL